MNNNEFLSIVDEVEKVSPEALNLLKDFALLNPKGISEKLYSDIESNKLNNILDLLEKKWLIERQIEEKKFTIEIEIQNKIMDLLEW